MTDIQPVTASHAPRKKSGMNWFYHRWREISAMVFLTILIMDFIVFPMFYAALDKAVNMSDVVANAVKLTDPGAQAIFIRAVTTPHVWVPMTLQGNGFFFLSFAAILGVSAWGLGRTGQQPYGNPMGGMGGYPNQFSGQMPNQPYPMQYPGNYPSQAPFNPNQGHMPLPGQPAVNIPPPNPTPNP